MSVQDVKGLVDLFNQIRSGEALQNADEFLMTWRNLLTATHEHAQSDTDKAKDANQDVTYGQY